MVQYVYDAWGNHVALRADGTKTYDSTVGTVAGYEGWLGNINPFRYRSYYFDQETCLYYLQTRYYDPQTGRFISQDNVSYLDPQTINGLNLYAYCGNNAVMGYDPNGTFNWKKFWGWVATGAVLVALGTLTVLTLGAAAPITGLAATMIVGATIGATISFGASIISQAVSGQGINPWQVLLDTTIGAIGGLVGGSGANIFISMGVGGVLGFAGSVGGDLIKYKGDFSKVNWIKAGIMGVVGIASGAISGAGVKNMKEMTSAIQKDFAYKLINESAGELGARLTMSCLNIAANSVIKQSITIGMMRLTGAFIFSGLANIIGGLY